MIFIPTNFSGECINPAHIRRLFIERGESKRGSTTVYGKLEWSNGDVKTLFADNGKDAEHHIREKLHDFANFIHR